MPSILQYKQFVKCSMNYDIPLQNICMDLFLKFWPRGNAIVLKPRRNFHFTPRNKIPTFIVNIRIYFYFDYFYRSCTGLPRNYCKNKYTTNHATFPIKKRKITVQICGNFWVTQYHILHWEYTTAFQKCSLILNVQKVLTHFIQ